MRTKVIPDSIDAESTSDTTLQIRLAGLRLERLLMTHYRKQVVIATCLDMDGTAIFSRWFSGKALPSGRSLLRMANLGFNVQWILTGSGYPYDVNTSKGRALADKGLFVIPPTVADLDGFTSDASEQEVHA